MTSQEMIDDFLSKQNAQKCPDAITDSTGNSRISNTRGNQYNLAISTPKRDTIEFICKLCGDTDTVTPKRGLNGCVGGKYVGDTICIDCRKSEIDRLSKLQTKLIERRVNISIFGSEEMYERYIELINISIAQAKKFNKKEFKDYIRDVNFVLTKKMNKVLVRRLGTLSTHIPIEDNWDDWDTPLG